MAPRPSTVQVRRRLSSAPEELFDVLLDPERLASVRGVTGVSVLETGAEGPRSAGTVRRVGLPGGQYLVEELVAVSAPFRFDYLLRDASVPLDHQFGRIELRRSDEGTEASWTSTFVVPGRFGRFAQPFGVLGSRAGFLLALGGIDRVARTSAVGAR